MTETIPLKFLLEDEIYKVLLTTVFAMLSYLAFNLRSLSLFQPLQAMGLWANLSKDSQRFPSQSPHWIAPHFLQQAEW